MKSSRRPAGSSRRAESSPSRAGGAPAAARVRRGAPAAAGGWLRHPAIWSAVLGIVWFAPSIFYGYVRDDHELIRANPFLHRAGWLLRLLTSDFWRSSGRDSGMWRPLVVLSYWIDGRVFQWQPWGFHAVNVLAHGLACAAVTLLVTTAGVPALAAFLAGAWFAVMPPHVESVAWISGRTDLLCGLGFALALLLDRRARRAGAAWPGVAPLLALLAALLSKEAALPFVLIVALAEWVDPPPRGFAARAALRWLAPYAAVTVAFLVAHRACSAAWAPPPYLDAATTREMRWGAFLLLPHYVATLWPWYPHSPDIALRLPAGPGDPRVIAGAVITAALVALLVVLAARRARAAVPYAIWLVPLLTFPALAWITGYFTFAERNAYLPSIGAAGLLGLLLGPAGGRGAAGRAALACGGLLVAASAWQSARLVPQWRDDLTMFHAMIVVQPDNVRARIGYANQLAFAGREPEALDQLARVQRLDPRLSEIYASRATIRFRHGDWPAVLDESRQALAREPANPQARLLAATALMRLRRLDEATALLRQMMRESPGDPAVEGIWGQVLLLRGDPLGARPFLEHACAWAPDDASVSYALGMACQLGRDWPAARDAFAATVRIDPAYYDGWLHLANAAHEAGDAAARDRALAAARALPDARDGRADAMARQLAGP